MPEIIHNNSYGVQMIFRRVSRTMATVKVVQNERGVGVIHCYSFKNILFYEHQYLSWANLDCCEGWSYDREYLYTAVQNNKKLVAEITDIVDIEDFSFPPDVEVCIEPYPGLKCERLIIAKKGCLRDYFNIDSIVAAYTAQDFSLNRTKLLEYWDIPLIELFKKIDFRTRSISELARPEEEYIIMGLGFGYPIESTTG